ncbi:MAG: hypothetical protein KDD56_08245 [Bdellovibrionales bacterium]|nr:hypothetical protein [Bdellovibrionales bacterium]
MASDTLETIPFRDSVEELVSSRYDDNKRPESWDLRKPGKDVVRLKSGKIISLQSDGGQSPPKPGWVILLTDGNSTEGYHWTLYGIPKQ